MNISIIAVLIILSIYALTNLIRFKDKRKKELFFLNASFLSLFVILFLRKPFSDLEVVYLPYFHFFKNISMQRLISFDMELLYKLLVLIISYIYENDRFFIFIIDLITCMGPYIFIRKYSKNYLISMILFVAIGTYFMQFYLIRQAIAISLLLCSIKYIEEKKFWKFLLFVIIASLFHTSALLFIVVYFFSIEKFSKVNPFIFVALLLLGLVFRDYIGIIISQTIYKGYLNSIHGEAGNGYGRLSLYLLLLLFNYFLDKKNGKSQRINDILKNMSFLYLVLQLMATRNKIIGRLANYFCMSFVILTSNSVNNFEEKKDKALVTFIIIIITLVYLYFINQINGYSIMKL